MKVTVDGRAVDAIGPIRLLEVADAAGVRIPRFCHLPGHTPRAVCRLCVIDLDGAPGPVSACATPARDGMVIRTDTARVRAARRAVLRLTLEEHGPCDHRDCALCGLARSLGVERPCPPAQPSTTSRVDRSSDYLTFDAGACIRCDRCVAVCDRNVVGRVGDTLRFDGGDAVGTSRCVQCGDCVAACPAGALSRSIRRSLPHGSIDPIHPIHSPPATEVAMYKPPTWPPRRPQRSAPSAPRARPIEAPPAAGPPPSDAAWPIQDWYWDRSTTGERDEPRAAMAPVVPPRTPPAAAEIEPTPERREPKPAPVVEAARAPVEPTPASVEPRPEPVPLRVESTHLPADEPDALIAESEVGPDALEPPNPQRRILRHALIAAVLVFQILLPLRYYVGDDLFDERFSWRMFSPIRMVDCEVDWFEGSNRAPVDVESELHMVWRNLMGRARLDVVNGYADSRCERMRATEPEPELYAQIACAHPDGQTRFPVPPDANLCQRGIVQ